MIWKISYTQREFRQVFPVSDFRSERSHGLTNLTLHRQVIYWYFSRLSDSNLRGRGMQLVKSQSGAKDTPNRNIRAAQNLDRS